VQALRIEWGVSRRALGDRAPLGTSALITLRFETQLGPTSTWVLIDPKSNNQIALDESGETQVRVAGGCVHVHGPSLYAFISIEHPDQPELLYARTDVFERLQILGGRYQPLGARVERH